MQVVNLLKIPMVAILGMNIALMAWSAEFMTNYYLYRDTADWIVRAELSGHAGDAAKYIEHALQGMQNWEVNSGYAALIWKSPRNDMGLMYKGMHRTYERLQAIAEKYDSPGSPFRQSDHEYGQTLKDIRRLYSTLPLKAPAHYLWLIKIGLPFEVVFYAGLILFGYGIIRPLVKEITWVDLAFIAPFFIGLLKAFWYG
jgi:hypothetical protein